MKKVLLVLLFCLCLIPRMEAYRIGIEGRTAFFFPFDNNFRNTYGFCSVYGAELTFPFFCDQFALWTSANYYGSYGHTIGRERHRDHEHEHEHHKHRHENRHEHQEHRKHTTLYFIPVGFGFKYFVELPPPSCIDRTRFYFGAGLNYIYLKSHVHANHREHNGYKNSWNYVVKTGITVDLPCNWFLDTFFDFTGHTFQFKNNCHKKLKHSRTNLSGLSVGLGIGYNFGWTRSNEVDIVD